MVSVLVSGPISYSIGLILHFAWNETVEIGCRISRYRGWFFSFFLSCFFFLLTFGDLNLHNVEPFSRAFLIMCCSSIEIFYPLLLWITTNCRSFPCLWSFKLLLSLCFCFFLSFFLSC